MIALIILLVLSISWSAASTYLLVRATKRLLEFDEIFGLFADDISTNVKFFKKIRQTPMFENTPEIVSAAKNMDIMRLRLEEYGNRFEELTGKKLLSTTDEKVSRREGK